MAKINIYENNGWKQCWFYCEGCKGHHCFTVAVPKDEKFVPWTWNNDVDNPTFSPSLLVNGHGPEPNTRCHSFVKEGKIQFLSDCFHALKNQTIELQDVYP